MNTVPTFCVGPADPSGTGGPPPSYLPARAVASPNGFAIPVTLITALGRAGSFQNLRMQSDDSDNIVPDNFDYLRLLAHGYAYNGHAFERVRSASSATLDPTATLRGALLSSSPAEWSQQHQPGANVMATTSRAATVGLRHICRSITASLVAVAAQPSIAVLLRDGPSLTGTVIWSALLASTAGLSDRIVATGLNISTANGGVMTLEFEGAPAAGNFLQVALGGYSVTI